MYSSQGKEWAMETLIRFIAEYVREHEAEYEEWKKEQEG